MSDRYYLAYSYFTRIKMAGMILSGLAVFIMMFYTSFDVILRNLNGTSPLRAYEVSQYYFMPIIVFPALAYTFSVGMMPRIEFIITKFNSIKFQKVVAIFLISFEIILMFLLAYFGLRHFQHSLVNNLAFTAGGSNYSLSPVIALVPIGFGLVVIEMIFLLIKNIKSSSPHFNVIERQEQTDI